MYLFLPSSVPQQVSWPGLATRAGAGLGARLGDGLGVLLRKPALVPGRCSLQDLSRVTLSGHVRAETAARSPARQVRAPSPDPRPSLF